MKYYLGIISLGLTGLIVWGPGCTPELPTVPAENFYCEDGVGPEGGNYQCPTSHWCSQNQCLPRLGCTDPGGFEGCESGLRRCEPVYSEFTTAVRCEGGIHTSTSVRPPPGSGCDCPDGLHCAFLAGSDGYELYLSQDGQSSQWLSGSVRPDSLFCVRACSNEANCSAGHTCRPALMDGAAPEKGRLNEVHTVGVCYPNRLVETSSTSTVTQPDPKSCLQASDCPDEDACRYRIEVVADHPTAPIGTKWTGKRALVPQCVSRAITGALKVPGQGCTEGTECSTGLCISGRCSRICDPDDPFEACNLRNCVSRVADRRVDADTMVTDAVFVCEAL